MTLAGLLSPDRIVANMVSTEHWPAIVELVDHLIAGGNLSEDLRDSVLEAIREREDQCSTGIGGGKAIPHIYSEAIEEVIAIFGRSGEGVEFGAIDSAPVFFIVLLIVPKAQYNLHLKTLAAIARSLSAARVHRQLTEAENAGEILEILKQADAGPKD